MSRLALALILVLAAATALALEPGERLSDPALEARARAISKELRCLVCQNQSIDDSDADLARDLRRIVRDRLVKGDTNAQVIAYVTARYGDFVLLRPPVKPATWLLWFGPALVLLAGLAIILTRLRRRRRRNDSVEAKALSADEERRLAELIEAGPGRPDDGRTQ